MECSWTWQLAWDSDSLWLFVSVYSVTIMKMTIMKIAMTHLEMWEDNIINFIANFYPVEEILWSAKRLSNMDFRHWDASNFLRDYGCCSNLVTEGVIYYLWPIWLVVFIFLKLAIYPVHSSVLIAPNHFLSFLVSFLFSSALMHWRYSQIQFLK